MGWLSCVHMCNLYIQDRTERSIQRVLDAGGSALRTTDGSLITSIPIKHISRRLSANDGAADFRLMLLKTRLREWGINIILLLTIVLTWIMENINERRSRLDKIFNRNK